MLIRLYFIEYYTVFYIFLFLLWKIYEFSYIRDNVNNEKEGPFFVTKFITLIC